MEDLLEIRVFIFSALDIMSLLWVSEDPTLQQ
jgi:hypothetical protein